VIENLRVYALLRADRGRWRNAFASCSRSWNSAPPRDADCHALGRHEAPADHRARPHHRPELIILDEPTTGSTAGAAHDLGAAARAARQGSTLLLTTTTGRGERLCDELVIVDNGTVLERGSPRDLIRKHVEAEVLEVRGAPERARAVLAGVSGARIEELGDTHYCYTRDARALLATLEQHANSRYAPAGQS